MTQQEIQDRNKEIARMLGYKTNWLDKLFYTWKCRFLYDWNLLMEAVEFIEKSKYDVVTAKNSCGIWTGGKCHVDCKGTTKKETVVETINQFLIWYNNENRN